MAQRGRNLNTAVDVGSQADQSQFSYARDRLHSVLGATGGVLPGSVARIGDQAFIKNRITLISSNYSEDNQSRNREQLENLKRQLVEKERNKSKNSTSPSTVGGSFKFSPQATEAPSKRAAVLPADAVICSPNTKRTEAKAELLGIIEVRTSLRKLSTVEKKELAQMSITAVVNGTPNIKEDELELGPIIETKRNVGVMLEEDTVNIMVPNATGGGEHALTRHAFSQVGVIVHTSHNRKIVYIGRDAMGRRTAVVLNIPKLVEYTDVLAAFNQSKESSKK